MRICVYGAGAIGGYLAELDALVVAVQELGKLTSTPTPTLDILLALAQERGRQAGLYQ
jgi:2-dehydropantoate 2-reductase